MISVFGLMLAVGVCNGDQLQIRGQQPTYGLVLRQTAEAIVFQEMAADQTTRERTVKFADVERAIRSIDVDRLVSLDPDNPQAYRQYAEHLASLTGDPFARQLARRLYLLAAYRGNGEIRRSAFRGLISLTDNLAEKKRICALAFKTDGNLEWLQLTETSQTPKEDPQEIEEAIQMLRSIRNRDFQQSSDLMDSRKWKIQAVREMIPRLHQICRERKLDANQLRRILNLELGLRSSGSATPDWNRIFEETPPDFRECTFQTVTQFDPELAWFRNGVWTSEK